VPVFGGVGEPPGTKVSRRLALPWPELGFRFPFRAKAPNTLPDITDREPAMNAPTQIIPPYKHTPLFPLGKDTTTYREISSDGVRVETIMGREMLVVSREALRLLSEAAFMDINHLLRPAHLASLKSIVEDPEASDNDKFVAFDFLKNANIAAGGVLPMCQDTGTAIIMGKKGRLVFTDGDDEGALAEGARDAYLKKNLRYSQSTPRAKTTPTRCCSSPRAAARPTKRSCSRRRRRS
jgi:hypothetical protein